MTEVRQAREVDMVPAELRFVPQVKSDIIIQRRNVSLAPVEGMNTYQRDSTNTITFNVQGHKELSQLLDTKSLYFTMQVKFQNGYPVEDVSMLFEEVIISSNGRTLERIRHAQNIQHFLRGYGMSRKTKARLGKREGFQRWEDRTIQDHQRDQNTRLAQVTSNAGPPVPLAGSFYQERGFSRAASTASPAGYTDTNAVVPQITRQVDGIGYHALQVRRQGNAATAEMIDGWPGGSAPDHQNGYRLMKFRLECSGLLSCDKMLPIGWMPLTIQLRLSDRLRATDSSQNAANDAAGLSAFNYVIRRPRMHMVVCSVGQAYASAMQQRLRGPGITINVKMFDVYFQIINGDRQIVIPSNKQRLSKVWAFLHDEGSINAGNRNAFRSSVTGRDCNVTALGGNSATCLTSYQFQVGTEVSEAVTLEDPGQTLVAALNNPNTGQAFLEAYLRAIGAVNGKASDVEFWGKNLDPRCNLFEGGDLLQTFLSKYFVACYDGEKLLGSQIETGVDTESGKDIILDLRFGGVGPGAGGSRMMALVQYHAQLIIKENSVELSY